MCAAVLPWLVGASAVASTVSALSSPKVPDAPAPVKIEATPATPTSQDQSTTSTENILSDARDRRRVAASWYSTNKTSGTTTTPAVKKTLLGGLSTPLGG